MKTFSCSLFCQLLFFKHGHCTRYPVMLTNNGWSIIHIHWRYSTCDRCWPRTLWPIVHHKLLVSKFDESNEDIMVPQYNNRKKTLLQIMFCYDQNPVVDQSKAKGTTSIKHVDNGSIGTFYWFNKNWTVDRMSCHWEREKGSYIWYLKHCEGRLLAIAENI